MATGSGNSKVYGANVTFYMAQRKRNGRYIPGWMILKSVGFQQYQPIHICSEYTKRHVSEYTKRHVGLLQVRLNREKERIWDKGKLNKRYHLIPITEEEAAERIFIDT